MKIELTKDKFGETITVTEGDHSKSYAERNWSERSKFNEYRKLLGNNKCLTV